MSSTPLFRNLFIALVTNWFLKISILMKLDHRKTCVDYIFGSFNGSGKGGVAVSLISRPQACFSENNPGADHLNDNTILKSILNTLYCRLFYFFSPNGAVLEGPLCHSFQMFNKARDYNDHA